MEPPLEGGFAQWFAWYRSVWGPVAPEHAHATWMHRLRLRRARCTLYHTLESRRPDDPANAFSMPGSPQQDIDAIGKIYNMLVLRLVTPGWHERFIELRRHEK